MRRKVCIISCTAHKRSASMHAEDLYCSELFYKSRRYAQANYDAWLILSAKHGLVRPCDPIAPYDCKLTILSRDQRRALQERVAQQAPALLPSDAEIHSICGEEYDEVLEEAGLRFQARRDFALPIGKKLQALGRATDPEKSQDLLDATYKTIKRLEKSCSLRRLRDVVGNEMPESGVYIFFDERQRRLKNLEELRVVRVGTHGVASGSKASLRNRIKTHFGTIAGEGNHRSSIFRLHTGRSLINAQIHPEIASWGSTSMDSNALRNERALEQAVSKYLSELYVLLITVPGLSDKNNDRAYLEQNLIALLSNGCSPLDPPSCEWLGLNSAKREIRKSGLWNVNHVEQPFDPGFLDVLDYYVSVTTGKKPVPPRQLAPPNWQVRLRNDSRQFELL